MCPRGETGPEAGLSGEQLVERLRLRSAEIVKDLHALATRQIDAAEKREAGLNSKATSLLSASGVSMSLMVGLANLLSQNRALTRRGLELYVGLGAYAAALTCCLLAGVFAILSLKITSHVTVSEGDVFGSELRQADDQGGEEGADRYRRYMTAHLWRVYKTNSQTLHRKARKILSGQYAFLAFLVLVLVCGGLMVALVSGSAEPQTVAAPAVTPREAAPVPTQAETPLAPTAHRPPATAVPSSGELVQGSVPADRLPGGMPTRGGEGVPADSSHRER